MTDKQKKLYKLSEAAVIDLSDIYDYTISEIGKNQADSYLTGIEEKILMLLNQQTTGRNRDEIRKDLKSINFSKHVIFYSFTKGTILIVRILHIRRDIPKQFDNK